MPATDTPNSQMITLRRDDSMITITAVSQNGCEGHLVERDGEPVASPYAQRAGDLLWPMHRTLAYWNRRGYRSEAAR